MKNALSLLFVGSVTAANLTCDDFSSCSTCKVEAGCGWYTLLAPIGGTGDSCYNISTFADRTSSTLFDSTPTATCDECQAGSCSDCQAQDGCAWASDFSGLLTKCQKNTSLTSNNVYTDLVATCPACDGQTCASCYATTGCNWYEDFLGGFTSCGESAPFGKEQVIKEACVNNPCSSSSSCRKCRLVTSSLGASLCQWYEPSFSFGGFVNSKCDLIDAGAIDNAYFTAFDNATVCPECSPSNCLGCVGDIDNTNSSCKWSSFNALGIEASGNCETSDYSLSFGEEFLTATDSLCSSAASLIPFAGLALLSLF